MSEQTAAIIWLLLAAYLGVGLVVAGLTLLFGLGRLEPGAAGMTVRVRVLVFPGLAALWPLVLMRLCGVRPKEDRQ